jgi:hypothetical protein
MKMDESDKEMARERALQERDRRLLLQLSLAHNRLATFVTLGSPNILPLYSQQ